MTVIQLELTETTLLLIGVAVVAVVVVDYFFTKLVFRGPNGNGGMQRIASAQDISKGLSRELQSTTTTLGGAAGGEEDDKILSPVQFRRFTLIKSTRLSHNSRLLRFELPPNRSLGLTLGRHITLRAKIDENQVMRAYTPTTKLDQTGYFELIIKAYEFGKMSSYLNTLSIGTSVEVRGPVGRFQYQVNAYKQIGLIAGGTGLTPCLQMIRHILTSKEMIEKDITKFIFFYQNRTEEDILLYDDIVMLAKQFPQRLQVKFFVSNPTMIEFGKTKHSMKNIEERHGYIKVEDMEEYMKPYQTSLVCLCGPSGFNESMKKHLYAVGHEEQGKSVFVW